MSAAMAHGAALTAATAAKLVVVSRGFASPAPTRASANIAVHAAPTTIRTARIGVDMRDRFATEEEEDGDGEVMLRRDIGS
jgi:hypothetical protein